MRSAMDLDLASCSEALFKFAVFVLVQALVYLILSQSSDVFSGARSLSSFRRPARSVSLRRMVTQLLTEMPAGGELSSPAARLRDVGSDGAGVDVDLEIELMLIGCSFSS
ncbi:uncharacterized protein LOC125556638 [Triticum urartu]|uniref:uncharacterized protein LOC125556638 n=1 Tax=Triticum urartu TaxID=4572 RepID=UPI002044C17F|nr:uncharacterized protein LOC125556638 [Triticum urartu]